MKAVRQSKARPVPARRLPEGVVATRRSGVTNGSRLFVDGGDEGSAWTRRFCDVLALRLDDLGGADLVSEGQLSLSRRASAIECELERMEAGMSAGEEVDLDLFGRLTGTLARVLEKLGLERVKRTACNPILDHFTQPHGGVS